MYKYKLWLKDFDLFKVYISLSPINKIGLQTSN